MARNSHIVPIAISSGSEARALAAALAALTLVASMPGGPGRPQVPRVGAATLAAVGAFDSRAAAGRPGGISATVEDPLRAGDLPWRAAGLTERQAAAHLLSRFTFGARPGDVDRVVARGLERWLEDQLAAAAPDRDLARRLAPLRTLGMPADEIAATYPNPGLLLAQARREGLISERPRAARSSAPEGRPNMEESGDEARAETATGDGGEADPMSGTVARRPRRDPERRAALERLVAANGYRRQGELFGELLTQKVVRAVYSENQLAEVLTDFWFNHFNVALTDPQARAYVLAYERDAIRPHVLGRFDDLLRSTARHPAMLQYLDNARSMAPAGARTTLEARAPRLAGGGGRQGRRLPGGVADRRPRELDPTLEPEGRGPTSSTGRPAEVARGINQRPESEGRGPTSWSGRPSEVARGINENYARELLELHTLGVDGGYSQSDVVEVARAFTGWTVVPRRVQLEARVQRRLALAQRMDLGVVRDGDFLFRPDAHDAGAKQVLGRRLPAGRGIEDGEEVLALLATHPSTARHIATKVARRFVADEPPASLVDRLAEVFGRSDGDMRALLRALARSPELWAPAARAQKVKSPFELAVSALRALGAELSSPAAVVDWVGRMGQPLYAQQAPTGWPDRAQAWVNTGSLLARMNFGLELASGSLPGVAFDLGKLASAGPVASPEDAIPTYGAVLLPERAVAPSLAALEPLVAEEGLSLRLAAQAPSGTTNMDTGQQRVGFWENPFPYYRRDATPRVADTSLPARVVGVLLGSPEFQRR